MSEDVKILIGIVVMIFALGGGRYILGGILALIMAPILAVIWIFCKVTGRDSPFASDPRSSSNDIEEWPPHPFSDYGNP